MISFTAEDITAMLAYVGTIFNDFKLLIFLLIGVFVAFYIAERIIGASTGEMPPNPWTDEEIREEIEKREKSGKIGRL